MGDLLLIVWADAVTEGHGWRSLERIRILDPEIIYTVGWLVKETPASITLVSSITSDGDADGDIVLPKGCILQRVLLSGSNINGILTTKGA